MAHADSDFLADACDRFEQSFLRVKRGEAQSPLLIEGLLNEAPPALRQQLLADLLECEWFHLLRDGQRPRLQPYVLRFLADADVVRRAFPAQIGPYELKEMIGGGGFGRVYVAHDRATGQQIALKVFKPGVPPPVTLTAIASARAIVPIGPPQVYGDVTVIPMQYVDGETLEAYLTRHRRQKQFPTLDESLAIARSLVDVLVGAHQTVTHLDLKPANVLLADGQAYLIDFDLAQPHDGAHAAGYRWRSAGTDSYMSPEQLRVRLEVHRQNVGDGPLAHERQLTEHEQAAIGVTFEPATDLWAFGVMFYELLTLEHPFHDVNDRTGEGRDALFINARHANLVSARARRPELPACVAAICEKCLQREPSVRYRDAKTLLEALDECRKTLAGVKKARPRAAQAPALGVNFYGTVNQVVNVTGSPTINQTVHSGVNTPPVSGSADPETSPPARPRTQHEAYDGE